MRINRESLLVYAVTDRKWLNGQTVARQVEEAIIGGATFIQLREKQLHYDDFLTEAIQVKKVTDCYNIPFVINDQVDIAIACDADGVHIGQDDLPVHSVRSLIGPYKILGVSAQTVEQAMAAEQAGADYLGVGAMFPTSTKQDAERVSFETLKQICEAVSIPVVAIGGITEQNVSLLSGSGIAGVAVISALFAQNDIKEAAKRFTKLSKQMVNV
ncbi:thiamine phosphate synthase [Bacillus sp. AGMB 02131]|uniref:Thiamine-phosphate synthase n=1 Tax=Peribacillus faecalis TaxID=2772559 RepID=A0A927HBS1_9BACI|nr:thiamine phosphate synthase [Peribacillus faecalis]MBD3110060.1 thiamine phosphate synthase [Peribacillus faecalis]